MSDAEVIRIIREAVPDVVAVYRFGSTVSGQVHTESDVDLAFLAPRRSLNLEIVKKIVVARLEDFQAFVSAMMRQLSG